MLFPLAFGCIDASADTRRPAGPRAKSALAQTVGGRPAVVFEGTCDASGAVPIDHRHFALADDENNVIRVYDADLGGPPVHAVDVSPELGLERKRKEAKEADLEAATRLGDEAVFISSHARTKKGKEKPERFLFFSTPLPRAGQRASLSSPGNRALLQELLDDPRLQALGLPDAAGKSPIAPGGLNLEGMTATPEGDLLLGFRNPVPQGRALLVPLLNPRAALGGDHAQFGEPVLLDLDGLSVRGLSHWRGRFLIAAGRYADGGSSRLFTWRGPGSLPEEQRGVSLAGFSLEAFFTPESRSKVMLLSDDGTRMIGIEHCKDLDRPERKRFRGIWVELDAK